MKTKLLTFTILITLLSAFTAAGTLSVSEVEYVETDSDFFDEHVLIEFQADGTGETLHAEVDSSTLTQIAEGETTQDIEISANVEDVAAEYQVEDRGLEGIQGIEFSRTSHDSSSEATTWAESNCMDLNGDGDINADIRSTGLIGFIGSYIVDCAIPDYSDPSYNVGFIQSPPDTTFEARWDVETDSGTESVLLSNSGIGEGQTERIGDHTQIEFIGLRDMGSDAPNPQNTLAAYSSQSDWKLINENSYRSYEDFVTEEAVEIVEEMPNYGSGEIDDFIDTKNAEADQEYSEASTRYYDSALDGAHEPSTSGISSGVWEYRESSDFEWFVSDFLVRVDGDFVGIEKSFAEPEIVSVVDGAEVDGLGSDTAEVQVRNDGDGAGLFEAQVSCTGDFTQIGTSTQKSVDPGETVSFYPLIDASADEELEDSCEFSVEDSETLATSSTMFDVSFSPDNECSPGEQWVDVENGNEVIYECADDGLSKTEVEVCGNDEEAEPSGEGYECVEIDDRDTVEATGECEQNIPFVDRTFTDPICEIQNTMNDIQGGVSLAIAVVEGLVGIMAALVGWFISRTYLDRLLEVADATDKESYKIGLGIILALGLAIAVYSFIQSIWVKLGIILALLIAGIVLGPFFKTITSLTDLARVARR